MSNNGTKEKHETNRRINTARDILVGKIPDPKAQVEQITTALIYKFMDDMDRSSEELGGIASFLIEELAIYQWNRLMSKEISGTERLHLYSEALLKFSESERIPEIFRKIFKDAFLPYRDPEILNLFLKEIDWFDYDHSENLGDAFEYLLNILGSQGDAGQFRTPRHIIDFIIEVVKPRKIDKILDPACGTAGFLISAYKFILKNEHLTPQDKQQLMKNFSGYDISPDMVRLSLVNLYLHGFPEPKIQEYDTLTSEKLWNERFGVILANPPFMTPKGGIRPHNRFMVQAKRSEVLFVDYIAEHLTLNGRGGVIVPEGIIFQSAKAYQALRKMLIEDNFLWAVVSLPSGIFQPYSGVKTSILLFDRTVAKQQDSIIFVKIANDGFDLGAQRREHNKNDLPQALTLLEAFQRGETVDQPLALVVSKAKIAESGDFNLTGDRYKETIKYNTVYPMVKLGEICQTTSGGTPLKNRTEFYENGIIPWLRSGEVAQGEITNSEMFITEEGLKNSSAKILPVNTVLVAMYGATAGQVGILKFETATNQAICGILPNEYFIPKFLFYIIKSQKDKLINLAGGGAQPNISQTIIKNIEIPLPPLEIQNAIVAEIEQWQKVIDGAKQVVAHYRPTFSINPEWEVVKLGDVCEIQRGKFSHRPRNEPKFFGGKYPFIQTGDIVKANGREVKYSQTLNEEGLKYSKLFKPTIVLISIAANIGDIAILNYEASFTDSVVGLIPRERINPYFLALAMETKKEYLNNIAPQSAQKNINNEILKIVEIPLPPLEEQNAIVAEIEKERAAVEACKQLIAQFEAKIKAKIATVWGE